MVLLALYKVKCFLGSGVVGAASHVSRPLSEAPDI